LLNAAVLLAAVAVPFLRLAAAFALVGGEGAVGGVAYANAFLNVAEEAAPEGRDLAMTVAAMADTVGVALAGGAALGAHGLFCPTAPRPTA
ncbi:LOW QUALITY PROTEIN: battenin, partial [Leptosomus discolor]